MKDSIDTIVIVTPLTTPEQTMLGDSFAEQCPQCRTGNLQEQQRRAQELLLEAQSYYTAMHRFRVDRERCRRYTYGDQWGDVICVNGRKMTEGKYLAKQGSIPLENNLIRRLVRTVIGLWRSQGTEPTCYARDRAEQQLGETMSTVLQYNMQLNDMQELLARSLEEFLISGMVVHKKTYGWRNDRMDCWTDYVQPNNFFIDNNMRDFRGWDCNLIGEIHDVTFDNLCAAIAKSPSDYDILRRIYSNAADKTLLTQSWNDFGYSSDTCDTEFLMPRTEARCRVIEIWRREQKPRYRCHDTLNGNVYKIEIEDLGTITQTNQQRIQQALQAGLTAEDAKTIRTEWFIDNYWYYYWLSPFGDILAEGETPYAHKSHPYVFKIYPYIDGEVHSFVSDVIDQQRYTNRLITLYDMIMRASAKGVLMIPRDSLKGMNIEDFVNAWSRPNGVLVYEPSKSGEQPRQLSANSANVGIDNLLQLQLKFFEDISGVNGSLQGKAGYSGMSAALYNQQTNNATTSLLDILDTYRSFVTAGAVKDVKNIQQFYDQRRTFNIAGRDAVVYDPALAGTVEYDIAVIQSTQTPAYRALSNDMLMQLFQGGQITLEEMLASGSFPFADTLLQKVQARKQQEAQMQQAMQQQAMEQQQQPPTQ